MELDTPFFLWAPETKPDTDLHGGVEVELDTSNGPLSSCTPDTDASLPVGVVTEGVGVVTEGVGVAPSVEVNEELLTPVVT